MLLVLQAAAFYAIPHNSFAKPAKVKKAPADMTAELLAELDIEGETEPTDNGFTLASISHTKTLVRIDGFAYTSAQKVLAQHEPPKKYCLNCAYIFYQ